MTAQPESPFPLAVPDAPSRATLFAKMARILAAVPRVQKSGENAFHHYKYVTESDLLDAIRGLLAAERVAFFFATDDVRERPTGAKDKAGRDETVTTVSGTATFCCGDSGATMSVRCAGSGADFADKGLFKAITGALKYALLKTFMVSTGDDPERHADGPGRRNGRQPDLRPAVGATGATPATIREVEHTLRTLETLDPAAGRRAQDWWAHNAGAVCTSQEKALTALDKLRARELQLTAASKKLEDLRRLNREVQTVQATARPAVPELVRTGNEDGAPYASPGASQATKDAILSELLRLRSTHGRNATKFIEQANEARLRLDTEGEAIELLRRVRQYFEETPSIHAVA